MKGGERLEALTFILVSLAIVTLLAFALVPILLGLYGKSAIVMRAFRGATSALYLVLFLVCASTRPDLVGCRTMLSFILFLMTSSLAWFINDVVGICLVISDRSNTRRSFYMICAATGIGLIPAVTTTLAAPEHVNINKDGLCWFHGPSIWSLISILALFTVVEAGCVIYCHQQLRQYGCQKPYDHVKKLRFQIHSSAISYTLWAITCCFSVLSLTSPFDIMQYLLGVSCVLIVIGEASVFVVSEPHLTERIMELTSKPPTNDRPVLIPDQSGWMTNRQESPVTSHKVPVTGMMRAVDNSILILPDSCYGNTLTGIFGRHGNVSPSSRRVLTTMAEEREEMISRF